MGGESVSDEEKISAKIKSLFKSYAFKRYKLTSFEEYSLYAENLSFLPFKNVLTFSDGEKLLALRPDVTLSVVKNVRPEKGETEKLFYDEKVFRKSGADGAFKQVRQLGVEILGEIDAAIEAETLRLMLETLEKAGKNFILDISHMGITAKLLSDLRVCDEDKKQAVIFLNTKNKHDFEIFAKRKGVDKAAKEAFCKLIELDGSPDKAVESLKKISADPEIQSYVLELKNLLAVTNSDRVNINFSFGGDAGYYNGLTFKGYIDGVPNAVLAGGRYDLLAQKFTRESGAIGFALYLGELTANLKREKISADAVVLYGDGNVKQALDTADKLRKSGKSVLLTRRVPENFKGEIYGAEGEKC